jgi:hypothetical protein
MNRDLDLRRAILEALEDHPRPEHVDRPKIDGRSQEEVAYHLELLCEAGLVRSEFKDLQNRFVVDAEMAKNVSRYIGERLNKDRYRPTWAGHEFLAAARDNTRWNKAKGMVAEKTGGLSFAVLQELLVSLSRTAVGL